MLQQRINIARGELLKLTLQVSFGSLHISSNMLKASAAYTAPASCRYICAEYRPLLSRAFLLTDTAGGDAAVVLRLWEIRNLPVAVSASPASVRQ